MWIQYKDGIEIGQKGSENGIIVNDEEYRGCCRITLEKGGAVAPYSITCGIYGLMSHTAFASSEEEADKKYFNMQEELQYFIDCDTTEEEDLIWLQDFTNRF